ncbi:MAG: hypothetical protein K2P81_11280 [Bacteriovoracaceae bacterium]|nr:hypothetical protein [Bacteriovoracaceae bacterium]
MRQILLILTNFILLSSNLHANDIIGANELANDARTIIRNLGLNCGQPQNYSQFIAEVKSLVGGIGKVSTEFSLQLGAKKDFPTVCHVLTQNQLNSYSEGTQRTNSSTCVMRSFGKCVKRKHIKKEKPMPSYWWPKYFIEVTEKGNDAHSTFDGGNNLLFSLNRNLANSLSSFVDENGAITLTSYVMGGSSLLSTIGVKTGDVSSSDLMKASVLTPLEKLRFRGSRSKTQSTFDVNIWPVANSKTLASHLTVCGPDLVKQGRHPGGYSWSMEGIPMTCPVAMSNDAFAYWDTGMTDYIDPEIVSGMLLAANPLSCGIAQASKAFSDMGSLSGNKIGDQNAISGQLSSVSGNDKQSLQNCSWPILGTAEAIAKKSLSLGNLKKWKDHKCTLWGALAPRTSSAAYGSDYSFANTALKFKLLSHEMFGIPRGEQERWSLAYPWEGKGSSSSSSLGGLSSIKNDLTSGGDKLLKQNGINIKGDSSGSSRSDSLLITGSPLLVNSSVSSKYIQDRVSQHGKEFAYIAAMTASGAAPFLAAEVSRMKAAQLGKGNILSGDRRIYTIWEKVSCVSQSTKVTEQVRPMPSVTFYDSCTSAVRFEVYKYVQLKLLRRICDSFGATEGKPWL